MFSSNKEGNLFAILGPTNTGKTYLAFERILAYQSGIFGFPLRLLARENYDRAVKQIGSEKVALITGEEKILPNNPRYFFCTVESMPINTNVECVAIDEIQLSEDYERGHIFTDRILNFRGSIETILLGSLTIKKILKKIFPNIIIKTRERFSNLSFSKKYNISKIKPRSAVIAFNVNKVYEIAEKIRSIKGGTAVVLGSLSPRTRNAQVEIYENKDVDYLVATDAIGMGLNLNIEHVVFSSLNKYDGRFNRNLRPAEIAQIAGRAGRFQSDGTFGLTKDAGDLDPVIIKSIEEHKFSGIQKIYWRNSNIDFSSISSVLSSLAQNPEKNFYIKKSNAEDEFSFRKLSLDLDICKYLNSPNNIKLLWDVCRIPDFRKIMNNDYIILLKDIFLTLVKNEFLLPENWIQQHVLKLEDYSGGIDELSNKITNIRTWTYITNQSNWLINKKFWQEKTRTIEDNLSDQLHEQLTNRFIDLSASYFVNKSNKDPTLDIKINNDKFIVIDGQKYGSIMGFGITMYENIKSFSNFTHNHVRKKARFMIKEKIKDFVSAPNDSIHFGNINLLDLSNKINLYWGEEIIGTLKKGENIFSPIAEVINHEALENDQKLIINNKLQEWINNKIKITLKPLQDDLQEEVKTSDLRSITFNLFNALGTMPVDDFVDVIRGLTNDKKSIISKLGIRIGVKFFYIPNLLKKIPIELKAILWKIFSNDKLAGKFPIPLNGRVSFVTELSMPKTYWQAIGYLCINNFAIRVDVFEKIFFLARKKIKYGPFLESSELMNPLGCNSNQLADILDFCGINNIIMGNEKKLFFFKQKQQIKKGIKLKKTKFSKSKNKKKKSYEKKIDHNSPFAVLQKLL